MSNPKLDMNALQEIEGARFCKYHTITYLQAGDKKIPINVFMGVDPSCTDNARSDRFIIFVLAVLPSGKKLILDIFAERVGILEHIPLILQYASKYRPRMTTIETVQYQKALYENVKAAQTSRRQWFSHPGV